MQQSNADRAGILSVLTIVTEFGDSGTTVCSVVGGERMKVVVKGLWEWRVK